MRQPFCIILYHLLTTYYFLLIYIDMFAWACAKLSEMSEISQLNMPSFLQIETGIAIVLLQLSKFVTFGWSVCLKKCFTGVSIVIVFTWDCLQWFISNCNLVFKMHVVRLMLYDVDILSCFIWNLYLQLLFIYGWSLHMSDNYANVQISYDDKTYGLELGFGSIGSMLAFWPGTSWSEC